MSLQIKNVVLSGLDPVPIWVSITEPASQDAIFAAAGIPPSMFIDTVQPFQLRQHSEDTYELMISPRGYGTELLEALRWLARVAATGIIGDLDKDHTIAFVEHYLEVEKPEWRYEELTEHAADFITNRYQRAIQDTDYRRALQSNQHDPAFTTLIVEIQQWMTKRA